MFTVAAFYRFTPFDDPPGLRGPLARTLCRAGARGTVLLAEEGINGTIAGRRESIDAAVAAIRALPGCAGLQPRESRADGMPFARLKVRIKREIVTLGRAADPRALTGRYVAPADWNALIQAPDVVTIDTRNDYEVAIGSFRGAVDPKTPSFRDFPGWWDANRARLGGKRIAMFCTGGIRCEKATSFLLRQGAPEVLHLQGGILNYLATIPEADSLWEGACFVFDGRVALGHGLRETAHSLCHGCRRPLAPADLAHPVYEPGVACHHCAQRTSHSDKDRFRQRHRQLARAAAWRCRAA